MTKKSASKPKRIATKARSVVAGKQALSKASTKRIAKANEELDCQHVALELAGRCRCGKVETAEPLEMCVSCPVCDVMMHTVPDQTRHSKCDAALVGEVVVVPKEALLEGDAPVSKRNGRRRAAKAGPVDAVPPAAFELDGTGWESFFKCQRSPMLRSQLLTALMAGTPLEVERVPTGALLDAVLLAFASRTYCEAEVVDDFTALLRRADDTWKQPDWTTRVFSSIHGNAASFIIRGAEEFTAFEDRYIPGMVRWYLGHDAPEYFSEELKDEASKRARRAA